MQRQLEWGKREQTPKEAKTERHRFLKSAEGSHQDASNNGGEQAQSGLLVPRTRAECKVFSEARA
jgi:hypothetical protein